MDDLAGKLSQLLEDPEGMESLRSMASSLLGGSIPDMGSSNSTNDAGSSPAASSMSADDMQTMMKIGQALSKMGTQNDDRTKLLMSLRPHLSSERQERVDNAVKILRLISMLPLLTEKGLF